MLARRTMWLILVACGLSVTTVPSAQDTPPGDAGRGKALVESSGCFDCHRIDDRGSRLGPNLSSIGARRTTARLREALVDPDAEVIADNRFARIVTKDGASVTGKLLNQDAISVQVMNPKEELKTYLRANVREFTILDKGLMPSVQGKLTNQPVDDIVAYLSSLSSLLNAGLARVWRPPPTGSMPGGGVDPV